MVKYEHFGPKLMKNPYFGRYVFCSHSDTFLNIMATFPHIFLQKSYLFILGKLGEDLEVEPLRFSNRVLGQRSTPDTFSLI